nr:uroporphyrinogen-III synthase [Bacillus coahuilensis]
MAAVGEKTAKHLRELGVEVDFLPSRFTAEDMIQEFLLENPLAQHILIPKGNLASSILSNGLAKERISHQEWVIYKNEVPTSAPQCLEETVKKHRIDCVTFTSSSAVKNYIKIVNERNLTEYVRACKYAVIGSKTKQTAHNMGLEVHICPDTYTIEAMVEEIKTYFTKKEYGR